MKFPTLTKGSLCWHLPSLHAVRITDKLWGGKIFFFKPIVIKGKEIGKAGQTELKLIEPEDKAIVLGYGVAGETWAAGTIVTILSIFRDCSEPLHVYGPGNQEKLIELDSVMRYAPARVAYLKSHFVEPEDLKPVVKTISVKKLQKKAKAPKKKNFDKFVLDDAKDAAAYLLDANIEPIHKKLTVIAKSSQIHHQAIGGISTEEAAKALVALVKAVKEGKAGHEKIKKKTVIKSAKTIVEEARAKCASSYNPDTLAISQLMLEYEALRRKYGKLLKQLKSGKFDGAIEELEKTEEEIRKAENKLRLGFRKFK